MEFILCPTVFWTVVSLTSHLEVDLTLWCMVGWLRLSWCIALLCVAPLMPWSVFKASLPLQLLFDIGFYFPSIYSAPGD
jgi:hypothetical protein